MRDLILEGIYRVLEALGFKFAWRIAARRPMTPNYEGMLEAFYRKLPLQGAVVVDVGAHVGRHALPLSEVVGPAGMVHAFEPLPFARARLAEQVLEAGTNNIAVYPFAVGATPGRTEFNYVPDWPEESGLKPRARFNDGAAHEQVKLPVHVVRLDEALPAALPVRFVKIDVEGGELDVLRGARRMLEAHRPIVAFECGASAYMGYHETPDEIFEMFRAMGYIVHGITAQPVRDTDEFRRLTQLQAFWDYVAFPPGEAHFASLLATANPANA